MNNSTKNITTKNLVTMALFSAILCVSAYLSIPLPNGSHLSLLNFALVLITLIFPLGQSVTIVLIWFFLGLIGIPVYAAGASGLGYLTSQWGGYNFGFLAAAILIPLLRKLSDNRYHRLSYTLYSILAVVIIDIFGSLWLLLLGGLSVRQSIVMGFLPFIPLDLVKAVVLAQIVPQFRRLLQDEGSNV